MKFNKINTNPLNNKTGDCVIRAISTALKKGWKCVYIDLFNLGIENALMLSDIKVIKKYLSDYEHQTCKAIKGKPRKKVKDFDNGTYILSIANHLTCVIDNELIDAWDCREKCVYRYWRLKKWQKN